jgi:drug/metabolite transporter (DMT)-like permease
MSNTLTHVHASNTRRSPARTMATLSYTTLAMIAFAANSVICRIALREGAIDAASFSSIRLVSGTLMLLLIAPQTEKRALAGSGSWTSAAALFLYAVPFSFAYTTLSAATGALILFGCVQATMMIAALRTGERPHAAQWVGMILALAGLVYLVWPGLAAPPLRGAALMAVAGFGWGVYSLRGRGAARPLAETTSNFLRSVPLVLAVSAIGLPGLHAVPKGIVLAALSGAVASGLGYVAWYAALGGLTATRAAIVQLAVPILAAVGGVLFLAEAISARLVLAAVMVLGGIALALNRSRTTTGS